MWGRCLQSTKRCLKLTHIFLSVCVSSSLQTTRGEGYVPERRRSDTFNIWLHVSVDHCISRISVFHFINTFEIFWPFLWSIVLQLKGGELIGELMTPSSWIVQIVCEWGEIDKVQLQLNFWFTITLVLYEIALLSTFYEISNIICVQKPVFIHSVSLEFLNSCSSHQGMRVVNIVGFRRGYQYLNELLKLAQPFGKVVKHLVLDLRPEVLQNSLTVFKIFKIRD